MTAHKCAEMIKAKADNMELVVLCRNKSRERNEWGLYTDEDGSALPSGSIPMFEDGFDYFLCLPQHKQTCLHWLNGGKSQLEYTHHSRESWVDIDNDAKEWSTGHVFMDELLNIRIKPRKESRYVVLHKGKLVGELFEFDADIRASYGAECHQLQIFEIEVEV